jgi:hypothetical protein
MTTLSVLRLLQPCSGSPANEVPRQTFALMIIEEPMMRGLTLSATVALVTAIAMPAHANGLLDQLLGQRHKDKHWHEQRYGQYWQQPQYNPRWQRPKYGYGGPPPAGSAPNPQVGQGPQ